MHERDRQTHTPHDGIGRGCIASRGKNWLRITCAISITTVWRLDGLCLKKPDRYAYDIST